MTRFLLIFSLWCLSVNSSIGGKSLDFSRMGITKLRRPFIVDQNLTDLNLSHNHIWNVDKDIFDDLPSLVDLDLSDNFFPFTQLKFKNTSVIESLNLDKAVVKEWDSYDEIEEEKSLGEEYSFLREFKTRRDVPFDITFTQDFSLPKLKYLYLSDNNITEIKFEGVDALDLLTPEITHLYLSNNKLKTYNFEKILPMSLQELYLDNNELTNLDVDNLNSVRVLAIDRNKISNFCDINEPCEGVTLKHSYSLEVLSMTGMGLEDIKPDAFKFLVNVENIDLSNNQINSFPNDALSALLSVKTLLIDNNSLDSIPETKGLNHLENLSLSSNIIQSLTEKSFSDDLKQLKRLNLSDNIIRTIPDGTFDKLVALEELDLSRNMLNTLPENWISDKSNLQFLLVNNNFFQSFSDLSLEKAKNLKSVFIGGNKFSAMDVGSLTELPKNAVIDFEDTSRS